MTLEQKQTVQSLRSAGFGYKKIAAETGIPMPTIKSYFHRMPEEKQNIEINRMPILPKSAENVHTKPCRNCGQPVIQNPGRKEKKFCEKSVNGNGRRRNNAHSKTN